MTNSIQVKKIILLKKVDTSFQFEWKVVSNIVNFLFWI